MESGLLHASAVFTAGETAPGTHRVGGWKGPKADLEVMGKRKISCLYWESNQDSSAVQISRRTDWANPAVSDQLHDPATLPPGNSSRYQLDRILCGT
jgi:hypothetical protein